MPRAATLAVVLITAYVQQTPAPVPFDPVGKWSVSTSSDEGQPRTATVEIAGRPGAYTGQATTGQGRVIPIREVMTSPTGMMILADLPNTHLFVRIARDSSGKYTGAWGELEQTFFLTAQRNEGR